MRRALEAEAKGEDVATLRLAVEINVRMDPPARAAKRLARFKVKADVTVPAALRTFKFPSLAAKNVTQSQGDLRVTLEATEVDELGTVLKTNLLKLESALDRPAYNYIIHTSPFDTQALPHYHWHIEVIPRLTRVAGFEWGTGFYINPVPPEQSAAFLREVEVDVTATPKR